MRKEQPECGREHAEHEDRTPRYNHGALKKQKLRDTLREQRPAREQNANPEHGLSDGGKHCPGVAQGQRVQGPWAHLGKPPKGNAAHGRREAREGDHGRGLVGVERASAGREDRNIRGGDIDA